MSTVGERKSGLLVALLAAVLLWQGSPGQWLSSGLAPWGGLLATCAGLALFYVVATRSARPAWHGYLLGVVYMLGFSWSLRHISFAAYLAVGVVGGLYHLAVTWLVSRGPHRLAPLSFAVALAANGWLRAHMPEIYYPHGQPAHALYQLPWLLGPVQWGGEVLLHLLLGSGIGLVVECARARAAGGRVPPRWVGLGLVAVLVVWIGGSFGGARRPEPSTTVEPVDVVLIEPGVPTAFFEGRARFVQVLIDPLLEATSAALSDPASPGAPDLVVWPESSLPLELIEDPPRLPGELARSVRYYSRLQLPELPAGTRLVAGTTWRHPEPDPRRRGVVVLFDHAYGLLGIHEKRWPVPGGERVPFLGLLPRSWAARLLEWTTGMVRDVPDLAPGAVRPPLETSAGQPFAALLCYDNAFPGVAADAAAAGAEFLVVASNEAWYRQGAELDQMVALTVFRALETGLPVVRSTVDGPTCHVDRSGRVVDALEPPEEGASARFLRVRARPSPGARPFVLGLQGLLGPLVAAAFGLWAVFLLVRRRGSVGAQDDENPSRTRS